MDRLLNEEEYADALKSAEGEWIWHRSSKNVGRLEAERHCVLQAQDTKTARILIEAHQKEIEKLKNERDDWKATAEVAVNPELSKALLDKTDLRERVAMYQFALFINDKGWYADKWEEEPDSVKAKYYKQADVILGYVKEATEDLPVISDEGVINWMGENKKSGFITDYYREAQLADTLKRIRGEK